MLYDPRWERTVDTELTIPNLIAWLKTQPRRTKYDYTDAFGCLIAEFLKARGVREYAIRVPSHIQPIVNVGCGSHTYGAALRRARWIMFRQRIRDFVAGKASP